MRRHDAPGAPFPPIYICANISHRQGKLICGSALATTLPADYERAVQHWIERMPLVTGYAREEFETHVREENSTFHWVLSGMLEKAGLEILESEISAPEYAQWLCQRARLNAGKAGAR